ncbi:AAA-domain-containing protein [Clavulina sp. PMI_390]|nr:AAA-domain-containing protein [Clavulina sp. PMI_390]
MKVEVEVTFWTAVDGCLELPLCVTQFTPIRQALAFSSSSSGKLPRSVGGSGRLSESFHSQQQQLSSSATPPPTEDGTSIDTATPEKVKRKYTRSAAKTAEAELADVSSTTPSPVRANLKEILWQPRDPPPPVSPPPYPPGEDPFDAGLPEPWLLQDAYEALLLALHPQTQHRATYSSNNGLSAEPTLGFYCPIEGGDYIIDATVRSLAQRAKADVVVIDAVELSAGEHGMYGKPASVIQFQENPLKDPSAEPSTSSAPRSKRASGREEELEEDDDASSPIMFGGPAAFTIQIPTGDSPLPLVRSSRGGSGVLSPMSRGSSISAQRVKAFFDDLLNLTGPASPDAPEKDIDALRRPRIVYVRNYAHIAEHVPAWFPGLQAAVRARRQGPMARPTSPVTGPTVIVLGSCPPLSEGPAPHPAPRMSSNILSLIANGGRVPPPPKPPAQMQSWSEKDRLSRERRLKDRLRRWQRGAEALLEDIPPFYPSSSSSPTAGRRPPGSPEMALGNLIAIPFGRPAGEGSGSEASPTDGYFRVVGLVPRARNERLERYTRMRKRLKANELALKLAVAEAGGNLVGTPTPDLESVVETLEAAEHHDSSTEGSTNASATFPEPPSITRPVSFTDSCLYTFKPWRELKRVADSVVGAALSAHAAEKGLVAVDPSIEPTTVTWDQVSRSVESNAESTSLRNAWIQGLSSFKDLEDPLGAQAVSDGPMPVVDEVIEAVRKDPDLDQHEQRLLGCIVDPATMPTSFKSVHLPPSTIDAVRTMVSLPLLYPQAFSTGILKTHAMEGALLFGPPGTGKTLLARAIARESGARMMIIKPSDVMDMYVGEGEKLVRSVFTLARRLSPAVVFIDEIDALFGARVSNRDSGGTMAHRGIITEFMQEMDGLKTSRDSRVIVIGATNRPFDLDDAVLRRLPRRILVDLPGPKEREEILGILLRDEQLAEDVDLKALSLKTESFSGSDLKYLCIAAALDAVKESVEVPWAVPSKTVVKAISAPSETSPTSPSPDTPDTTPETVPAPSPSPSPPSPSSTTLSTLASLTSPSPETSPTRTLAARHFAKALREITPSASESLGTLGALRRWNEEFGEGAALKGRKRRGWGDRFGFGPTASYHDSCAFGNAIAAGVYGTMRGVGSRKHTIL